MLAHANMDQKMNIFQDEFQTSDVVAATGLPNHTLQSWLKRDLLTGKPAAPIKGGGVSGSHRKFSFFTVMEIAIAKALTDTGISAANALKAAMHFAHVGHGAIGDRPERYPSLPYPNAGMAARTLICVAGDRSVEYRWQVGKDIIPIIRADLGQAFLVLEVDEIFDRVCARLGYESRDVLNSAYNVESNQ